MAYEPEEFIVRAGECVRLATLTEDEMIRTELLQLRELYMQTAHRLIERRNTQKIS